MNQIDINIYRATLNMNQIKGLSWWCWAGCSDATLIRCWQVTGAQTPGWWKRTLQTRPGRCWRWPARLAGWAEAGCVWRTCQSFLLLCHTAEKTNRTGQHGHTSIFIAWLKIKIRSNAPAAAAEEPDQLSSMVDDVKDFFTISLDWKLIALL